MYPIKFRRSKGSLPERPTSSSFSIPMRCCSLSRMPDTPQFNWGARQINSAQARVSHVYWPTRYK